MANVVKKHSISSELAQKMVDEAVAKARELGVTENVAILDDGGNLKASAGMDGPHPFDRDCRTRRIRRCSASRRRLFQLHPGRPVAFGRIPRSGVWLRMEEDFRSRSMEKLSGRSGVSGRHGAERRRLRESKPRVLSGCDTLS